jgi:hypothetical protein
MWSGSAFCWRKEPGHEQSEKGLSKGGHPLRIRGLPLPCWLRPCIQRDVQDASKWSGCSGVGGEGGDAEEPTDGVLSKRMEM